MDNILRQLEGLRRDELVWLNTYLTGRLRALPPSEAPQVPPQPVGTSPCFPADSGTSCGPHTSHTMTAPAERIGEFNHSMDPWERTGAAPERAGNSSTMVDVAHTRFHSLAASCHHTPFVWKRS